VGSIITYSQLSRRSEIPAIRAAGVSAWRFLGPVIVLAMMIGVLMVTVLDPLATTLTQEFRDQRERILNPRTADIMEGGSGVWLSQGDISAASGGNEAGGEPGASVELNPEQQAIIHAQRVIGR